MIPGYLNSKLAPYKKIFGPDPATYNRCTIGGMVANNSTGAHSLKYGMTSKWIRRLKVMLSDGSIVQLEKRKLHTSDKLHNDIHKLLLPNQKLIEQNWPKTPRNRHGYLLKDVLDHDNIDLSKLFVSSEGTLGLLLEAELGICNTPICSKLIALTFSDRLKAAEASSRLLAYSPSAVEIIDNVCLDMAREVEIYRKLFPQDIKVILLVELEADHMDSIHDNIEKIKSEIILKSGLGMGISIYNNGPQRETVWQMRRHIAGMINRVPGKYQPVPLIEDVCVEPHKLKNYLEGAEKILTARGINFLTFGHAGDGTVHLRPFLDLKNKATYEFLPSLCEEIYDLTLNSGGTISGEHGDGFLRAPFIKKQYGEKLFNVFKEVKRIFDPAGILNPDKKTGCQDFDDWKNHIRYGDNYRPKHFTTSLAWNSDTMRETIEKCNGCGECRSTLLDSDMCPLFKVLGREIASPRAKINIIRSMINGELGENPLEMIKEISDLCLGCKTCEKDCPSGISVAELVFELRSLLSQKTGTSIEIQIIQKLQDAIILGGHFPKIFNLISTLWPARKMMDLFAGITSKRTFPPVSNHRLKAKSHNGPDGIVYFSDIFAAFIDTEISNAFFKVLKTLNIPVEIIAPSSCGIVEYTYGNTKSVKKIASKNILSLLEYARDGKTILCTEPSAALMISKEYPTILATDNSRLISKKVQNATEFLLQIIREKKPNLRPLKITVGYHFPCHYKVQQQNPSSVELLSFIPELKIRNLDCGCCGMAGTYGIRTKNYQTSMKIASSLFSALDDDNIDIGASDCSSCLMQMRHGVPGKKHLHPVQILAMALG